MTALLVPTETGMLAADAVRDIAARAVGTSSVAAYVEGDPLPWSVISEGGWDTIGIAEDDGGGGAELLDLVTLARAWGETCLPLPLIVSTMTKRWSPAARERAEPVAVAVPRGQSPASTGRVPFGTTPGILVARTVGSVSAGAAGDAVVDLEHAAADAFAPSLRLASVGWSSTFTAAASLEFGVVWAAEATGCARRLLEQSVTFAKDRQQFGKPIGSFQAVKHRLADMQVLAEAAETAVFWAVVERDNADRAARYALDASVRVAEGAIQVHGGMGFTWEMGLHFYLKHIVMLRELVHGLWS